MNEDKQIVKVETDNGEVTLSPSIVRRFLVNGNGSVSDQEITMFMALCKFQRLNPFLRQAYLVKYGTQPATIITGKEAFLKRAMQVKDCTGFKAGVVVQRGEEIIHTDGIAPMDCKLIGGWAEVHKKDWVFPLRVEVSFQEYVGKKADGSTNSMWAGKPATMIRKVALVQALREAFPVDLAGMYSPEEINTVDDLPHAPIDVGTKELPPQPPDQTQDQEEKQKRHRRSKAEMERAQQPEPPAPPEAQQPPQGEREWSDGEYIAFINDFQSSASLRDWATENKELLHEAPAIKAAFVSRFDYLVGCENES
jgi:phage recombination protein Bet